MELLKGAAGHLPDQPNRRRIPRLAPVGPVRAEVFGVAAPITITDVSVCGMKVQAPVPFWSGSRHVVRVTTGHAPPFEILARVVHCQRAVTDRGAPCFVVGWEFLPAPGAEDAATRLVELVAGDGPFGLVS